MKVVIVEDEHLAAEKLMQQLNTIAPEAEVLAVLESVEESVNWFAENPAPDLVFMDIQLDDGLSFEVFDELEIKAPIIFTTAFDEYAIRAFKVNSVDYLLKPIELEALRSALEKYTELYGQHQLLEDKVAKVIEQLSRTYKSRFFIKIGNRFQSIQVSKICCFFVQERSTFIKTMEGKTYDLDFSLDQLQKMVDPDQFYRISRNYLVNINCINEIVGYSSTRLKLKLATELDEDVIVSRDKVSGFKRWMDK
ncbi:LytTR family DNA-binding domain-containing protein [uncultured Draconibacterium sp.]|uniref:LytR/AlgR family response regulator transcription factor n=1 Tax=uncultured Draconibacterium sp. TaxID=1573823 RepID=UPI0025D7EC31|nr:LytTR family DNA-binding domain-containing protein [uncultured Draconibacterium sp.]